MRSRSREDDAHDQSHTLSTADATPRGGSAPDSKRERDGGDEEGAADKPTQPRSGRADTTAGGGERDGTPTTSAPNAEQRGGPTPKRGAREARNEPTRGGAERAKARRAGGGRQNHDRCRAAAGTT